MTVLARETDPLAGPADNFAKTLFILKLGDATRDRDTVTGAGLQRGSHPLRDDTGLQRPRAQQIVPR